GTIYVQGRGAGSTTVIVQAAGYNDGVSTVTVDPSGFIIATGNITTTSFSTNTAVQLRAERLDPTTSNAAEIQAVRGGLTVPLAIANSNPTVGAIVGSSTFGSNISILSTVEFDPATTGTTTISLTTPSGFTTPSNLQSITATVTAPNISIGDTRVGRDLQ